MDRGRFDRAMRDAWHVQTYPGPAVAGILLGIGGAAVGNVVNAGSHGPAQTALVTVACGLGAALLVPIALVLYTLASRRLLIVHAEMDYYERPGHINLTVKHLHYHEPYYLRCRLTSPEGATYENEHYVGNATPHYPTLVRFPEDFDAAAQCVRGEYTTVWHAKRTTDGKWRKIATEVVHYGRRNAADFLPPDAS